MCSQALETPEDGDAQSLSGTEKTSLGNSFSNAHPELLKLQLVVAVSPYMLWHH